MFNQTKICDFKCSRVRRAKDLTRGVQYGCDERNICFTSEKKNAWKFYFIGFSDSHLMRLILRINELTLLFNNLSGSLVGYKKYESS